MQTNASLRMLMVDICLCMGPGSISDIGPMDPWGTGEGRPEKLHQDDLNMVGRERSKS